MAASGTTGSGEPDMGLVSELMEEISRHPPAIAARKLLIEHYICVGWLEAASDDLRELKTYAPYDADVTRMAEMVDRRPEPPAYEPRPPPYIPKPTSKPAKRVSARPTPQLDGNLDSARIDLTEGYQSLRIKAEFLLTDILRLQSLQKKRGVPQLHVSARIRSIVEGRKVEEAVRVGPPGSVRGLARAIQANPDKATEIVLADLEDAMHWARLPHGIPSHADDDTIRDMLVKRTQALEYALTEDLRIHCELGLMHVVHEHLSKTYANEETMLGDSVQDISREDFYVTEDNWAWDMSELVQAITTNGGVCRNPMTRDMFTPKDIRGILKHPQGSALQALQIQQSNMSKGVRPATIEEMEKLAKVLLDDQSSDQLPSRKAVDEFVGYLATLPDLEQKAIEDLRCPARDSHTGQSYDSSIGETIRDAKGNRVCFHKTGDFIHQAADYLRQNRGAPADGDKCTMM